MLIPINGIKLNPGRRGAEPEDVETLAKSIAELGLLNPITIDQENTLIAGRHRLEAAKLLGWTEIECTVTDLQGLQAELAEIDENFVRKNLSIIDFGNLLLRRKEIYETLHPETKHGGDRKSEEIKRTKCPLDSTKSFIDDTAEKLGVSPRTVRREVETAKNLTSPTKEIIRAADTSITKKDALKLSRLEPEQQEDAATQLVAGEINSVDEYKPYSAGSKVYATFEESVADLKNPDKDGTCTPDMFLIALDGLIDNFHRDFAWYGDPECVAVFPQISQEQFEFVKKRVATVTTALEGLVAEMERSKQYEA
ncbi:ParB/RepB/Spo0J family partition protein [Acutalibacter muris]|uniref:ParB/RepB/Spo0J family partition protein n=1 Tax=Acutalibacter muris TaxID=1796620 RepID=UPI00272E7A1D|nr:ParB N-terminal domain-containing protein [Acutalibacter muris]